MVKIKETPRRSLLSFMSALSPFKSSKIIKKPETKAISSSKERPWLVPFISGASYYDHCPKHGQNSEKRKTRLIYFCTECPHAGALCDVCRKESHADHKCMKLYRCAKTSAVKDSQVSGIDLSDVYPYLANGEPVYFLRSDRARAQNVRTCVVCQRGLFVDRKIRSTKKPRPKELNKMVEDRKGARYCSLMCKFQDILGIAGSPVKNEVNYLEEELSESNSTIENEDYESENKDNVLYSDSKPAVLLEFEGADMAVHDVKKEEKEEEPRSKQCSPIKSFLGSFFNPFSKNGKGQISSPEKDIQPEDGISPGISSNPKAKDATSVTLTPLFEKQGNNSDEDDIPSAIELEDDYNNGVQNEETDDDLIGCYNEDNNGDEDLGVLGLKDEIHERTIENKCNSTIKNEANGSLNENNGLHSSCRLVEKYEFEDTGSDVSEDENEEEVEEAASSNQCSVIRSFLGSIFKPLSKGGKGRSRPDKEEFNPSTQKDIQSQNEIFPGISSKPTEEATSLALTPVFGKLSINCNEDDIPTAIKRKYSYNNVEADENEHNGSIDGDNEDDNGDEDMGVLGLRDENLGKAIEIKYDRPDALDIVPVGFLDQRSDQDQEHEFQYNSNPQSHQTFHIDIYHKDHTLEENRCSSHGENIRSRSMSRPPARERQIVPGGGPLVNFEGPLSQVGPVENGCTSYRKRAETFGGQENPLASITIDIYSPPYANFVPKSPNEPNSINNTLSLPYVQESVNPTIIYKNSPPNNGFQ